MNEVTKYSGVVTFGGGTTNVTDSAVGDGASVTIGNPAPQHTRAASGRGFTRGVGVVTILAKEAKAVIKEFGLKEDGASAREQWFYAGNVKVLGAAVDMVATQALGPGQRATMTALGHLRRYYDPAVLVLVGIGGAIHHSIAINDVVVATRVVYYDLRKITSEGVQPRFEDRESPAWMVHAVNSFFTAHGEPAELRVAKSASRAAPVRVFHCPIGSGDAVFADRESEIRKRLHAYNDKILAVDMEAGGLSQFCYETPSASGAISGWIVIRGISDHADHAKNDDQHDSAAMNAARTLRSMIPYSHTGA
jgi:adenosylhomocysteine nucleosidase